MRLLPALFCALVLIGCSSDVEENIPSRVIPKAGSTFTYRFRQDKSDFFMTYEVHKTGLEILGRKNVSRISLGAHTYSVAFDPNGDFGLLHSEYDSTWKPQPIASRQSFTSVPDTSYHYTYYRIHRFTIDPGEDTTRIIMGTAMRGQRVEMTSIDSSFALDGTFIDDVIEHRTYTWITGLGMFSDIVVKSADQSTSSTELVEYSLK